MIQKGNRKLINAWAMYDWANSAYSLTITSAIFPIYFTAVTTTNGTRDVQFLGRTFNADSLQTYAISLAFLVIAAINPLLSSIADYSGSKKKFMYFFSTLGALSCASLYFFNGPDTIGIGVFGCVFAAIGYAGSIVFYNAFLPEIAEVADQDKVSAKGFALGYTGSSLLLIFNLFMIQSPQFFFDVQGKMNELLASTPELSSDEAWKQAQAYFSGPASRISFLTVGIWWFVFAQYTFRYLPNNIFNLKPAGRYLFNGYLELKKVWNELRHNSTLKRFLLAFFFYNMGTQTVMYVATLFGNSELRLETSVLIAVVLIIQFVAIGGAYLFAALSKRFGNVNALAIAILAWILVTIGAYFDDKRFGVDEQSMFIAIAVVVGLVMGGIQSLSRSTYSKLLPETTIDHASYFSFYDVCDKMGTVLGTLAFGLINELTGSMRNSILVLGTFFLIGIFSLLRVRTR